MSKTFFEILSLSFGLTTAILSLLSGFLTLHLARQKEKIKQIETQLSKEKYRVYNDIFDIFFDQAKAIKGAIKPIKEADLKSRIMNIKKDLIIYASDEVAKKFFEWNRLITSDSNNMKQLAVFMELLHLIRKDMGHPKTLVSKEDIIRAILASDKDLEELKPHLSLN